MSEHPRGRLHQDTNFVFTEFDGLKIEKLVLCESPVTKDCLIVYIKVKSHNWHQYFLDAGIGFWEDWDQTDIDDDEGFNYVDKTDEFDLNGKTVLKIYCEPDGKNSRIVIELDIGERLILQTVDGNIFDGRCKLFRTN